MIHFATNIQLLRKRKKRTQEDVAAGMGLKRSTLSAYELGTVEPNLNTLVIFSKFYRLSIDDLIREDIGEWSGFLLDEKQRWYNGKFSAAATS